MTKKELTERLNECESVLADVESDFGMLYKDFQNAKLRIAFLEGMVAGAGLDIPKQKKMRVKIEYVNTKTPI